MDKLTVTGLVLRETAKGEADKLLTLLTAERGKMIVLGKGVRSLKNRNMVTTQQYCYATYILSRSRSGINYISDSDLAESFFGLRSDLLTMALAAYVCEVAEHCSVENSADVPLLRLTLNTLYALSSGRWPVRQIKASFEMRCAAVCGFSPDVSGCAVCGADEAPAYYLDILGGELFCPDCMSRRRPEDETVEYSGEWTRPFSPVSPELLFIMRHALGCDISKLLSLRLTEAQAGDFSLISERYLLHHLGRGFATLDYFKQYEKLNKRGYGI